MQVRLLFFVGWGKERLFYSQFLSQSEYGIACNAVQPAYLVDRYAVADSQFSEHVPGLDGVINCSAGTDAGLFLLYGRFFLFLLGFGDLVEDILRGAVAAVVGGQQGQVVFVLFFEDFGCA